MSDWTPDYFEPVNFETAVRQAREAWKGAELTQIGEKTYIGRIKSNASSRYVGSPMRPEEDPRTYALAQLSVPKKQRTGGVFVTMGDGWLVKSPLDSPEMAAWRERREREFDEMWDAAGLDPYGRWPDEQPDVIAARSKAEREARLAPLRAAYETARDAYLTELGAAAIGPESHGDAPDAV